jgi:hypothetical protein
VVVDLDCVEGLERRQFIGAARGRLLRPGCSMTTNAPAALALVMAPAWSSAGGASKSAGRPAAVTQKQSRSFHAAELSSAPTRVMKLSSRRSRVSVIRHPYSASKWSERQRKS